MEAAVQTRDLTKRYGRTTAVDRLSLTVDSGQVYGLVGPNGAGKTTFFRLILGLVKAGGGEARIFGAPAGSGEALRRTGAIVESPAYYPFLSGRDNLRVLADYAGIDRSRIAEALERVGLTDRAGDAAGRYSLGMRQRLALAGAFMKGPDLYLLDEPTNGLDPQGISAMRDVIRALVRDGATVLLSSHLLAEVEQVCDRIGIIHHGRLLAEESLADIKGPGALLVRAVPLEKARAIAERLLGDGRVALRDDLLELAEAQDRSAELNRELVLAGVEVSELRPQARSLEQAFLQLTGEPTLAESVGRQ